MDMDVDQVDLEKFNYVLQANDVNFTPAVVGRGN
jgi:hypothetical protein